MRSSLSRFTVVRDREPWDGITNEPYAWRFSFYGVIPVEARNGMAKIFAKIFGNPDDGKLFDSVRLSPDGTRPVTHLATHCPLRRREAGLIHSLIFARDGRLNEFPVFKARLQDSALVDTLRDDPRTAFAITRRINPDGFYLYKREPILFVYPKAIQAQFIPSLEAVIEYVRLQRIVEEGV